MLVFAFWTGRGAPCVSLMAGSKELIQSAHRHRQRLGGAMRQNGIFAAAALHGLDHHLDRLAEDHANARAFAEQLAAAAPVQLDLASVQTNIIVFHLPASVAIDAPTAAEEPHLIATMIDDFAKRIRMSLPLVSPAQSPRRESGVVVSTEGAPNSAS